MSIISAVQQFKDALQDADAKLIASEEAVIYYRDQKAKLEQTIAAIEAIIPASSLDVSGPAVQGTKKPSARAPKAVEIPATSSEFWMTCLSEEHQKTDAILTVAAEKLKVSGEDKLAILRTRQTVFLQKAAKDGKIKSEGERQNRVYFL